MRANKNKVPVTVLMLTTLIVACSGGGSNDSSNPEMDEVLDQTSASIEGIWQFDYEGFSASCSVGGNVWVYPFSRSVIIDTAVTNIEKGYAGSHGVPYKTPNFEILWAQVDTLIGGEALGSGIISNLEGVLVSRFLSSVSTDDGQFSNIISQNIDFSGYPLTGTVSHNLESIVNSERTCSGNSSVQASKLGSKSSFDLSSIPNSFDFYFDGFTATCSNDSQIEVGQYSKSVLIEKGLFTSQEIKSAQFAGVPAKTDDVDIIWGQVNILLSGGITGSGRVSDTASAILVSKDSGINEFQGSDWNHKVSYILNDIGSSSIEADVQHTFVNRSDSSLVCRGSSVMTAI